jgi:hypothetical protein
MSPSSKCAHIDLDDRTVGIDLYNMHLHSTAVAASSSSSPQPSPPISESTPSSDEHSDLPTELLWRIENSDPALTQLEINHKQSFKEAGCAILARVLSLNTCITSLDLCRTRVGPAGAASLFPAVTHLTAMTCLNLEGTDLQSSGASHLLSALTHLTAITELNLSDNKLTADDGARICGAAAAAGMTRLKGLNLDSNGFSSFEVVGCGMWRQLNLPPPPSLDIISQGSNYIALIEHILQPPVDVQIWDLAGQDVFTLSHVLHFSHRCMYALLWKPFESLDTTMRRVLPWLESLCTHVPDAHIVLVASHCKTNISDHDFLALSGEVEYAARAKVQELNVITRLEVNRLRALLVEAEGRRQVLQNDYAENVRSSPEFAQKDAELLRKVGRSVWSPEAWAARAASSSDDMSLSLRTSAAVVHDVILQEQLLCKKLQQLLGIRNGARPDKREPCQLTLHCKIVDSVHGYGVAELKCWLYDHCRMLPFMGQLIPSSWIAIAEACHHFGDSVLSRVDAIAMARNHLTQLSTLTQLSDENLWSAIEFWSLVGRFFVYESQVVCNHSTLTALLKPLLHHEPLQMMTRHQDMLVAGSFTGSAQRNKVEDLLRHLKRCNELSLELLDHLQAWHGLSSDQRSSMLGFFESRNLLHRVEQRPDVRFISARVRARPHLTQEVERVTAIAMYHVLYLLPLNHIGLIAHLQSAVSASAKLSQYRLEYQLGSDSLFLHSGKSIDCACVFSVESYSACVQQSHRFNSLHGCLAEPFSCVLRIACTDFGMLKFAAALADKALDSCIFGSKFQCWMTVVDTAPRADSVPWSAQDWVKFRDATSSTLNKLTLGDALQKNHHELVIPGKSIIVMFRPRSSIIVSRAWGDGTAEFTKRLKTHLEKQTLASVWVYEDGLNLLQDSIPQSICKALCQARIVFILLTPTYLTRPNCLRELHWALDFERAGHMRVVLLSLHPAVTFEGRLQLVRDGPLRGLVFSSKEKKVKRLCPEAIALVKRLNDVHMNMLPWHELQAWRSDGAKSDWEEHRRYDDKGTTKQVHLAGCKDGLVERTASSVIWAADPQGHPWLVCVAPHPASECVAMDDTDALSAADVAPADVPSDLMKVDRYPEIDAR